MNTYATYGVTIRSEFDLPELPTLSEPTEDTDVVFRRGAVEPVPESVPGEGGRRIVADPGQCRLSYDSYGSFLVENGRTVTYDPHTPDVVGTKVVRRLLENEMLGVLLHQRGHLVLHASAVEIDGRVALFLGPRGVGKSTTAAAFHADGYAIMEDDIVCVRFEDGVPVVVPGVPELRLKPDAVEALDLAETRTYADDGGSDKRYQRFEDTPDPAPVVACYILTEGESVSLDDASENDHLFSLIESTYTRGLLRETEQTDTHFGQCATVVETTNCRRLTRTDDHAALPSLIERVVDDIKSTERSHRNGETVGD
ncbi:hypothetical protein NDI56_18775 [Haloarcula sp. S1CR25-12]|uniref:Serine/threonine protein kinase n=1 Tax=Haloarcula saliterrae TaxID=2950534 RepID=A0ABU2FGQ6_9EURY|nr:hypothetical protein [Haloarcula sp. S1CR25-12]MDS0261450.1 hypothetical protein [Haloarcula sp. S1CR25-12]